MKCQILAIVVFLISLMSSDASPGRRISFAAVRPLGDARQPPVLSALLFEARHPTSKLLVVHGLQSSAEWFRQSGEFLSEHGITVLAYERRGSGKSDGASGDAETEADFLNDMEAAFEELKHKTPRDVPIDIHINCFGARAAFPFIEMNPSAFRRMILTSPSTDMARRADYSWLTKFFVILNPLVPARHYLPTPLKDEYFITRPEKELAWVKDDRESLSLRRVTKRFLLAARDLTDQMYKAFDVIDMPLCLILAKNDAIVDNGKIASRFVKSWKGPLKITILNSEHLMERSVDQSNYRKEMLEWLMR